MSSGTFKNLIGGQWVDGADGAYEIHNPANGSLVGHAPEASVQQSLDAARAAKDAFASWSRTKPQYRAELLAKAAEAVRAHSADLVPLVIAETGCTATVGNTMQVPQVVARFDRYARGAMEDLDIPLSPMEMPATALAPGGIMGAVIRRIPVGPVACISPYNFPLVNIAGKIGPALATGNTVVVRPASQDPLAVIELCRILNDEVGFPEGVINCVTGSTPPSGEALVETRDIDMISFTGSTGVGLRIAEVGGRTLKRLLLELGGKGAALVLEDADVKTAVGAIMSVWAFHSGQICTAPTRVIVHRSKYDELCAGLVQAAGYLKVGDPLEKGTVVGPLITQAHRARVESYIAAGVAEGATIAVGGGRPEGLDQGWYVQPTLITECRPDMKVVREEIFGPVVVVVPFDGDDEEGIAIANDSDFGLYDYVFSGDSGRALRVGQLLRAGNIGINTVQRHHEACFGGTKYSGIGRDGGSFGLHAYTELQSMVWSR